MSNLATVLQGVEVEWKPLGDVADYEQPIKYLVSSKNYDDRFKTPVLTAGKTFILGYTDETEGIYKASESPVIIFDDFTTANKWVDFDFKAKSSAMKMITSKDESKALIKYIYYRFLKLRLVISRNCIMLLNFLGVLSYFSIKNSVTLL
jgi:type I restriction enzyme S subunit